MQKIFSEWEKHSLFVAEFRPRDRFDTFSAVFCKHNLQLLLLKQVGATSEQSSSGNVDFFNIFEIFMAGGIV